MSTPHTTPTDRAVWSTADQNNLPDSSFAYVRPGKKDSTGRTVPRSNRFLPYKDANGKVDLPHLRNALARISQSGLNTTEKAKAQAVLDAAAKANGVGAAADDAPQERAASSQPTRYFYAPLNRIDANKREIEGVLSDEQVDTYGTVFDYDAMKRAVQRWPGNLREQHDMHKAVGRRVSVRFDDDHRQVILRARISEGAPDTWAKLLDGTLTGYSIGVSRYAPPTSRTVGNQAVPCYTDFDLGEASVVDAPSNPGAAQSGLMIYRADGSADPAFMAVEDEPMAPTTETETETPETPAIDVPATPTEMAPTEPPVVADPTAPAFPDVHTLTEELRARAQAGVESPAAVASLAPDLAAPEIVAPNATPAALPPKPMERMAANVAALPGDDPELQRAIARAQSGALDAEGQRQLALLLIRAQLGEQLTVSASPLQREISTTSALEGHDPNDQPTPEPPAKKADAPMIRADGSHEPMTGTHTHSHPAFGSQGDDKTHEHEHTHSDDADHHHDHADAEERATEPTLTRAGNRLSAATRSGMHDTIGSMASMCNNGADGGDCPVCQAILDLLDPDGDGVADADDPADDGSLDRVRTARLVRKTTHHAINQALAPIMQRFNTLAARFATTSPEIGRLQEQLTAARASMDAVKGLVERMSQQDMPGGPVLRAADRTLALNPANVMDASAAPNGSPILTQTDLAAATRLANLGLIDSSQQQQIAAALIRSQFPQ